MPASASLCAFFAAVMIVAVPAPAAATGPPKPGTYGTRLGSHSMLYLNQTAEEHESMFRAVNDAGVRYLRMPFSPTIVYRWNAAPDLAAVRRIDALAARYRIRVLADINGIPGWLSECRDLDPLLHEKCPVVREHRALFAAMVAEIVRNAPHIRYWELVNEPDNGFGFHGTARQYAAHAALVADAIRVARPRARIVYGGISRVDPQFVRATLHDRDNPLIDRIDIANVHLRGSLSRMRRAASRARRQFRDVGFRGRLWVTETGYPSLTEHQRDPRLRGGEADQARWIAHGPAAMLANGADAVFVTFRDGPEFGLASEFSSEGLMTWPGRRRKPAFAALQTLAARPLPRG